MPNESAKASSKASERFQEYKVKGNQLVEQVRTAIEEGNARRVIIKKDNRTLLEIPLSVGAGGAAAAVLLAPHLAALGALAALVTDVDVIIEKTPRASAELDVEDSDPDPATPI